VSIYTLVLDTVNDEPVIWTYSNSVEAIIRANSLAKQYPLCEVTSSPWMHYQIILDDKGSRVYIKECELIGGDHEGN